LGQNLKQRTHVINRKLSSTGRNHQVLSNATSSTGEHLEFCCHIRGKKETQEWCNRLRADELSSEINGTPQEAADNLTPKPNLWHLREWFLHQLQEIPLLLPRENWPDSPPPKAGAGWWYSCRTDLIFRTCRNCRQRHPRQLFDQDEWQKRSRVMCLD
jgi:hypothetical protein